MTLFVNQIEGNEVIEDKGEVTYDELLDTYTENEFAECLIKKVKGEYKALINTERWLKWEVKYWKPDARKTIHEKLLEVRDELITKGKDNNRPTMVKSASKLGNNTTSNNVIKEAFKIAGDHKVLVSDLNKNHQLLNLINGTLNLENLKFRKHRKEDLITEINNIEYDSDAKAERWTSFLNETFAGDSALIKYLQKYFGYVLTGDTKEHKLLYFYGTGANGKSTFINTIRKVSGSYAISLPSEQFMRSNGNNSDMVERTKAQLVGKRLGIVSEISSDRSFNEALIKELVSGDNVTARHIQQSAFEYKPTAKIVMIGNHKPIADHDDSAFFRRMIMVPFDNVVKEESQDKDLESKLEKEMSGILNWMIAGLDIYRKEGLTEVPEKIKQANQDYQKQCDALGEFLESECLSSESKVKVTELCEAYNSWLSKSATKAKYLHSKQFCNELRNRGYELTKTGNAQYCNGINLEKEKNNLGSLGRQF